MLRLVLHCMPVSGRRDLDWLAGFTGSLNEVYGFLLRAEVGVQFGDDPARTADEIRRMVDGRVTELGRPVVAVHDDAGVLELALPTLMATPVQALTSLALLLTEGPEAAAWPPHVRQAWFGTGDEPASARQAYDWLRRSAVVEMTPARHLPTTTKREHPADFPVGVWRSPPLDSS